MYNFLKYINKHDFNINDYSTEFYYVSRLEIIKKLKDRKQIIEFLKFLVHLTAIDDKFI